MGHYLFVLNVKQPKDVSEAALAETAESYLIAQNFSGSRDTYWGQGKADWFDVGGNFKGVLQDAASGGDLPKTGEVTTESAVCQYNGEAGLKAFLDKKYDDDEYHDIEFGDEIGALAIGDWLVAIDYHI